MINDPRVTEVLQEMRRVAAGVVEWDDIKSIVESWLRVIEPCVLGADALASRTLELERIIRDGAYHCEHVGTDGCCEKVQLPRRTKAASAALEKK